MIGAESARCALFVPGDRGDRFARAYASGAEAVILDLEDSVAPGVKGEARDCVESWLSRHESRPAATIVRINAADTEWHAPDVAMVAAHDCAVLLPKADTVEGLVAVRGRLGAASTLVALIETARGVRDAGALCACGAVDRVAFGSVDLAVELGIDPGVRSPTLDAARTAVVLASAAAGLPAPLDGVTVDVRDDDALTTDVQSAVVLGFGGKLAIHPRQVTAINAAWEPTAEQLAWAARVIAAVDHRESQRGVAVVDGQMVDRPLLTRARRLLARSTDRVGPTEVAMPNGVS